MSYLNFKRKVSPVFISAFLAVTACTKLSSDNKLDLTKPSTQTDGSTDPQSGSRMAMSENNPAFIRSDYKPGEIATLCKASVDETRAILDAIAKIPATEKNVENTLLTFENAAAEMTDKTTPLTFMGYVSTDPEMAKEGAACEEQVGQFYVEIFTRRDVYKSLDGVATRNDNEARLLKKTLESFEQNGLKLSDEVLAQVRELKGKLATNESQFSANLNKDKTQVLFGIDELEGVPADYLADLKKDASGNVIVNTKESDYSLVMQSAKRAETRKKMMTGYFSRGGEVNTKLLSDTIQLRAQIGKLMGFSTWADYRTNGRMAQNSTKVLEFLNGLKGKLAVRNQNDFAKILKFKQETEPTATSVNQWDVSYYSTQLQKRDYSLDKEKIKEYFPADVVIAGMFQVYSKMFGVRYEEIVEAKTWAKDVKMYAIHDAGDNKVIGYFYTDFFPREGKYGHAAAFPLVAGRVLKNGQYSLPTASIVSNLSPPMNGKPSLLGHDDVETIFHEFGHIMHQTLTRAPYASLSGAGVAQDFVEAPSQMLENWVWDADILKSISGHYLDHSQKLPNELLEKMITSEEFNKGYAYTKQLLYALFDMTLHTQNGPVDVNKTYTDLYKDVIGQEPLANQQFPASFGHLMGGYDAGYYGYLWSEVYAQDMFSKFPADDLTSPEVGGRYRKVILEQGNMKEALDLLREFLGREPNAGAFFKKLGI